MIALTISHVFTFSLISIQNILLIVSTITISSLIPKCPSSYSQSLPFDNLYFWLFLFNPGSFTFILSSFTLNLLSILTSSQLLAIFSVLSIFRVTHVVHNEVRNVGFR